MCIAALKTTSTDLDQEHADLQSQADIYTESLDMQMKKTPGWFQKKLYFKKNIYISHVSKNTRKINMAG